MGEAARPPVRKLRVMKPETELVRRSQQGDALAFEELVRSCRQKVFGLIYQILRSPEEVEDVAQEVFTKLYFSLPQFRLDSSFQAWLYRIVVNQCYDHLRKRKRSPQITYSDLSETEAMAFERLQSLTEGQAPGCQQDGGTAGNCQPLVEFTATQGPPALGTQGSRGLLN